MQLPDQKTLLELLETADDLSEFYDRFRTWLTENIDRSPLIFYQPRPLADLPTNQSTLAEPFVLRGEPAEPPGNTPIEELTTANPKNPTSERKLFFLEDEDYWYGALEYPEPELELSDDTTDLLYRILKLAIKLKDNSQRAELGDWTRESFQLDYKTQQIADYFLNRLSELFDSGATGYYIPRGQNYQLNVYNGFDPDEFPRRQTIPRNQVQEVQLEENTYLQTEAKSGEERIYVPLQIQQHRLGLLVVFSPGEAETETEHLTQKVRFLANLASSHINNISIGQADQEKILHDGLTGLKTESYFKDRLREEIERGERYDTSCSLLLLDIDNFAGINEDYSYDAGDAILRKIGELIKNSFRSVDIACRFTNDNFGILYTNTSLESAINAAQRLQSLVEDPIFRIEDNEININFSGGLAGYPEDGKNYTDILKQAQLALYEAKQRGKNKIYSTRDLS